MGRALGQGAKGNGSSPVPVPSCVATSRSVDVSVSGLLICEITATCSAYRTKLLKSLVKQREL